MNYLSLSDTALGKRGELLSFSEEAMWRLIQGAKVKVCYLNFAEHSTTIFTDCHFNNSKA